MQKEKTPENGEQCQQCRAESMEQGLSDVDVIQHAHAAQVVVQTELLLSVLPCPRPQCPLSTGMTPISLTWQPLESARGARPF